MTHSPADLAAAATQTLPYEPADLTRLVAAHEEIQQFERFVLDRFAAYTRSREVTGKHGLHGRERVIPAIEDGNARDGAGYGSWRVDKTYLTHLRFEDFILVYHYMDDDRGPGSRDITVKVPKAWIFGETERAEARAAYEALRPQFEAPPAEQAGQAPVDEESDVPPVDGCCLNLDNFLVHDPEECATAREVAGKIAFASYDNPGLAAARERIVAQELARRAPLPAPTSTDLWHN